MIRVTGTPEGELMATGELVKLRGNAEPYFSLQGDLKQRGRIVECGMLHERILKAWPDLADLAALHSSDIHGVPTHAVENGWYWTGGCSSYPIGTGNYPANAASLASHLRIPLANAMAIIEDVEHRNMDKPGFAALVDSYRPRWKAEAEAAIWRHKLEVRVMG
ncbi:MAG TPA: hypothetical protein VFF76_00345 [Holophagaceae bacterium]|jgi:hypothetical protein|nr:hypothetical protein [Holophagaceae bacterium]